MIVCDVCKRPGDVGKPVERHIIGVFLYGTSRDSLKDADTPDLCVACRQRIKDKIEALFLSEKEMGSTKSERML